MNSGLDAQIHVEERGVELSFHVPVGTTMALWGPNGSGKSTALDVIAGWLIPDAGVVTLTGDTLVDQRRGESQPRVWVAPRRRRIGYLSQQPRLFPHLSAQANVAYGMARAGITGRAPRKARAVEWLDRVGIAELARRRPHQLSGGQAQRVAIARVLASAPELVLLDEPLAALDVHAAPQIRQLLREVLQGHTTVLVTHHQADVDALADTIHRLERP